MKSKAAIYRNRSIILLFLLFVSGLLLTAQQVEIPRIIDPVTDETNTLSRSEYYELRRQIIHFEDSTSIQIVVLIIPTIGENEIRDFAIQILEQNKIGQKGKDNGVLILIAKDDRKMSIEVGYGLEGVLTDALCDQIIREEMAPRFREGNFYEGISSAITAITLATKGEYTAEKKRKKNSDWFPVLIVLGVLFFSLIGMMRRRSYAVSSRGYNSWWWGSGGGFGGGGFGSFGGGGWSAGGGSFGGGGASGRW